MRIRNFADMERAMSNRQPFHHRSYSGYYQGDEYVLQHWNTVIASVDANGDLVHFAPDYYSNTTSGFQGRIIRNVLSPTGIEQLKDLVKGHYRERNILNMIY